MQLSLQPFFDIFIYPQWQPVHNTRRDTGIETKGSTTQSLRSEFPAAVYNYFKILLQESSFRRSKRLSCKEFYHSLRRVRKYVAALAESVLWQRGALKVHNYRVRGCLNPFELQQSRANPECKRLGCRRGWIHDRKPGHRARLFSAARVSVQTRSLSTTFHPFPTPSSPLPSPWRSFSRRQRKFYANERVPKTNFPKGRILYFCVSFNSLNRLLIAFLAFLLVLLLHPLSSPLHVIPCIAMESGRKHPAELHRCMLTKFPR